MDLKDLKGIICKCGNEEYIQTFEFKVVPAVISQTGKQQITPIPSRFVCTQCGEDVYNTFMSMSEVEESKIIL